MSFPGYVVLRQDRPADYGVKAGGVATLIRSGAGIKYEKIDADIAPNDIAHSSIWDLREDIISNADGEDIEEWITSNEVQCEVTENQLTHAKSRKRNSL